MDTEKTEFLGMDLWRQDTAGKIMALPLFALQLAIWGLYVLEYLIIILALLSPFIVFSYF